MIRPRRRSGLDTLIRFKSEKYQPRRTLKLALTCGEETAGAFNGADWLTRNRRELIDAAFALNEGAAGELDAGGNRVAHEVEAGEKFPQNYRLEVTNKGGHSSRPVKDNAIYHLAAALMRISAYEFPAQFTDGNRAYFAGMAKILAAKGDAETANAMNSFLKNPNDTQALALVSAKDPSWNATLRTTCVATMLEAGHATNALPQRATGERQLPYFPGRYRGRRARQAGGIGGGPGGEDHRARDARTDGFAAAADSSSHGPDREVDRRILARACRCCPCCRRARRTANSPMPSASRLSVSSRCSWVPIWEIFTDSTSTSASSRCSRAANSCIDW